MRPESRPLPPPSAGSTAAVLAPGPAPTPGEADALCERVATRHYENFPVGSWLLPGEVRPAVRAVYAFARAADDYADEPAYAGRRLALLDAWERSLDAAFEGDARDPVFVALAAAIRRHHLPKQPFLDLLAAFRRDAADPRTPDWAALLEYCRLSANPIGRLMLHLFGIADDARLRLSDRICTGLQLANHWQDLAIDARRGRFYAPADLMRRCGVDEAALAAEPGSAAGRALVRDLVARSLPFFDEGRALCDQVSGRLRYELRLTWLGGCRILERIETAGGDVWRHRPRIGAAGAARIAVGALLWRR
ncbi:MAG TPA: squalene synthase HpnC [Dongiaceae bacterium]|nr:squalene synthase HpnC [Dongiaceae bacterium]